MPKPKNFMTGSSRPRSANDDDFAAVLQPFHNQPVEPRDLPIDRILPNPFQARRAFPDLDELTQAIRIHGFTSRLRVRHHPSQVGYYQLVFGERRLRAARNAGLDLVPCDIAQHTDDELVEIGLAENIQRRDLDPLEEAHAFRSFIDQRDYTILRLAERIGKDRSYVESRLALLRTPEDVQAMVAERPDTIRQAREIARLATPEERQPLIDGVLAGTLSKEDVRAIIRGGPSDGPHMTGTRTRRRVKSTMDQDQTNTAPPLDRLIERDAHTLKLVLGRWTAAAATMDNIQRRRVRTYLQEHIDGLEQLLALVQAQETRKNS